MKNATAVTAVLVLAITCSGQAALQDDSAYLIQLGSRQFIPAEGQMVEFQDQPGHVIVQFHQIPDPGKRNQLAAGGIQIQRYVGGNAYVALVGGSAVSGSGVLVRTAEEQDASAGFQILAGDPDVRATFRISPEMKCSAQFMQSRRLQRARELDLPIDVSVRFHSDVTSRRASEVLARCGLSSPDNELLFARRLRLSATWSEIEQLLRCDEIDALSPSPGPPRFNNAISAQRARMDAVINNSIFGAPTGAGVAVGIWDSGPVGNHADLGGRVTVVENAADISNHATHLAGTVGGSGLLDQAARGMASGVDFFSYDFDGDVFTEMRAAFDAFGILIANNSWGYAMGWHYEEDGEYWAWYGDDWFGVYTNESYAIDELACQTNLLLVFSGGNDRNDSYIGPYIDGTADSEASSNILDYSEDLRPPDPLYGSVGITSAAKNNLAVGATMRDDFITSFSSFGPATAGRLKPDLVAVGYNVFSTIDGDLYERWTGTSMSAPVVSGIAATLIERVEILHGAPPSNAMVKAILINSARDLGETGPDYSYGYGAVDAQLAHKIVNAHGNAAAASGVSAQLISGSLNHRGEDTYTFQVPEGASDMRVTLVWNDPAGRFLVNDLDVSMAPTLGGFWYRLLVVKELLAALAGINYGTDFSIQPWTLSATQPGRAAQRGRNNYDNVEHISLPTPPAMEWTIRVSGTAVAQGPQPYALVISATGGNEPPLTLTDGSLQIDSVFLSPGDYGTTTQQAEFSAGDPFYCYAWFHVDSNANYGNWFGTVMGTFTITNAAGDVVLRRISAWDGFGPNEEGYVWIMRAGLFEIPQQMPAGSYTLSVMIQMHNGQTATANTSFTVD